MADDVKAALLEGALAVLLDRSAGEVRYTQGELLAVEARRGSYRVQAEIDRSTDPPVIAVRLVPATGSMPTS